MDHCKDLLSGFLDRQLPEPELRRVSAHVTACADCRRELEELRSVCRLVAESPREPLPAGFLQRLERRRRSGARGPAPAPWFPLPFPARAAAFVLSSVVVMFVLYDRMQVMFPVSSNGVQSMVSGAAADLSVRETEPVLDDAPRRLRPLAQAKGSPIEISESAAAAPTAGRRGAAYTNEALQKSLESEKKKMGIRRILRPSPEERLPMGRLASLGGAASLKTDSPVPLSEQAAAPALLAPAAFGAAAGSALPAQAPPPDAAPGDPSGVLVRSEEERAALWAQKGLKLSPPTIDYTRKMLAVLIAPDQNSAVEISSVDSGADKIVVRYRQVTIPPEAARPAGPPSYQFRVLPVTDLPVAFEKIP